MSIEAFFDNPEKAPNLPEGGTAITLYDANDRPTEVQLHDPAGAIVSRTVRIYDDRGNILEERQTLDDPLTMLPATAKNNILSQSGASPQDLREQLTQFLGTPAETYSSRYEYDKLGRKTQMIRKVFNHAEMRTETSYNDHGDVAEETSSDKRDDGNGKTETSQSQVIYSYVYDSMGNWTSKKSTSRTLPDGSPSSSSEVRRNIEYY